MTRPLTRPVEYLLILAGSLTAGACGALFDQITATISPGYFLEGKNLAASSLPFRLAVAWTGFRGGLPLGALIVGVGLVRATRSLRFSWRPWLWKIGAAVATALVLCSTLVAMLDPFHVRDASRGQWSPQVATRYLICFGLHLGAYVGVIVGLFLDGRRD